MVEASAVSAQPYPYNQAPPPPPQGYDQGYNQAPPQGYDQGYNQAPPPGYNQAPYGQPNGGAYDSRSQRYDDDYAQRYSAWAAQYCVDRRNNNTAAGAVIGGILGALIGSGVAGHHERGQGAVVGGVLGAGAGAVVGSSSTDSSQCPPGYAMSPGAPVFAYGGPYVGVTFGSAPGWYHPWYQVGGQWYYRPYRRYYWEQHGWRGRGYDRDRYWRR
jgi:hypothetical protein